MIIPLLIWSCTGCYDAARQQQDNQAQQKAVADQLKQHGEALHQEQSGPEDDESVQDDTP
ncbi:MAG: hypothetical protein KDA80_11460 [Planctomycetaceae bacterium]|nr:hypothetical protein [Planctomycetaceae bacterium]